MPARPRRLAACLLALAMLPLLPGPGPSAQSGGFTVAVLRRDGVIIPFATFDGNRWAPRWPAQQAVEVPIGLADIPKDWWPNRTVTVDWKAWPVPAANTPILFTAPSAIKVLAPVVVKVHCTRRVGLRTDYVPPEPPPPPDYQPYPKSGLAMAGDVAIERVQLIQPGSPEASALAERVKTAVTEAESKSVRLWQPYWEHPVNDKGREITPLALEVAARTPGVTPGSMAYYFEGVKKYPGFFQYPPESRLPPGESPKREMCEYQTYAGGWMLDTGTAGASKATVGAALTNCNRDALAYTLPLGAIRTGGRLFWIVQTSSWDFERYDVIEIKANDVKQVLSVGGGGCR